MVRATTALRGKSARLRLMIRWLPECLAPSAVVELAFSGCANNLDHVYYCIMQSDIDKLWTAGDQTPEKKRRLDLFNNRTTGTLSRELLPLSL